MSVRGCTATGGLFLRIARGIRHFSRNFISDFDRFRKNAARNPQRSGAATQQSRVERHERVLFEAGVAAQMAFVLFFGQFLDRGRRDQQFVRMALAKRLARDRRHIGESPFFVARGGKSELGETREGAFAQMLQPRLRRFLPGEFEQPLADLFRHHRHH